MTKQLKGTLFAVLALALALLAGCAPTREELTPLPEYPALEKFNHSAVCVVNNKSSDPIAMLIYLRLVQDGYKVMELDQFSSAMERNAVDYLITPKGVFLRDVKLKDGATARDYFLIVDVLPCKNNPEKKVTRYKTAHRVFFHDPAEIVPSDVARQLNQNLFNTPDFRNGLDPSRIVPPPPEAKVAAPAATPAAESAPVQK
ncbi:MAG: hypothetical protein AB7F32_01150 [Victivallaceae bacterium]